MATYTKQLIVKLDPATYSGLGATLGYTIKDTAGTVLVARTTSGVAESGTSATYFAAVAAFDRAWSGRIEWDAGSGLLASEDFVPLDQPDNADIVAIKVVTDKLAAMLNATPAFTATALALAPTGGTAPTVSQIAAGILATPANLLATDATGRVTIGTNADKTGYALTTAEHTAIGADTQTGLTAQGYTTARAGFLDTLNGLVAAIWAATTRTLSAFGFNTTVAGYASGQDPATLVLGATGTSWNTAGTIGANINAGAADTSGVTTLLSRVPLTLSFDGLGNINARVSSYLSGLDPATLVLGGTASSWNTAGTIGAKINTSGIDTSGITTLLTRIPNTFQFDVASNVKSVVTAYATGQDPASLVWGGLTGSFNTAGTMGAKLNAGGSDTSGVTTLLGRVPNTLQFDGSNNVMALVNTYAAGQDPATLALDATASAHNTAGTIGSKINAAASAGDPWTTALPGSYTAGQAGNIVGNRLDTNVGSRNSVAPTNPTDYARNNVAPSWWTAPDNTDVAAALADLVSLLSRTDPTAALAAITATSAAIKTSTDRIPGFPASVSDIPSAATIADVTNSTLSGTHGAGIWGGGAGSGGVIYGASGALTFTYTVYDTDGLTPLPGVSVYVSADSAGVNRSQTKLTDDFGRVQFQLDAGTVYVWASRFDRTFASNPVVEQIS